MAPVNSKIHQLIESLTKEVLQEVLRGFKFQKLKEIGNLPIQATDRQSKMIKYADEQLPRIGTGSSRTVYALGSNKVLKIAGTLWPRSEPNIAFVDPKTVQRGLAQNEQEVNLFTNPETKPVVSEIYNLADDYAWIVSEFVRPFRSEDEFTKAVDVDEWVFDIVVGVYSSKRANHNLEKAIEWGTRHIWNEVDKHGMPLPSGAEHVKTKEGLHDWLAELFATNDFLKNAIQLADLGLSTGDLTTWNHWGKTIDGDVKLLDYGVTRDIIRKLYR